MPLPELAAAALATAAGGTIVHAALSPTSQLFGHTLVAGPNPQHFALTYDDGPNDACTPALLDLLARHNTRATFFMIGRFVLQRPALARQVQAAGHLIGNHTMTHPWLAWQTATRIRHELTDCNHALEDTLGQPILYFRPPHGARRPVVLKIAAELGLTAVQWNAMGKDWLPITPARVLTNIDRGLARNRLCSANILLHDGDARAMGADRTRTLAATEALLQRFTTEGKQAVTVDSWK